MKPKRIYILGTSGTGKTYFGKILSEKFNILFYDSDDVRFIKKFTKARTKLQRKKLIDKIIIKPKWIIDARGTEWDRHAMKKSDLIIWLQVRLFKRSYRILKRYFSRKGKYQENILGVLELIKYTSSTDLVKRSQDLKNMKNS